MKTITIIKRNRKYFAATTENGTKCRVLIDAASESLTPGTHTIELDDISVRSKYGTDLIFKLPAAIEEQADAGICTLKTEFYNNILTDKCRKLGGKWDAGERAWVFSGLVSDKVEELDEYYNAPLVPVTVFFAESAYQWCGAYTIFGFELAKATGRDSGANLGKGVSLITGDISSGGSMKNWSTDISAGSEFRMFLPETVVEDFEKQESGEYQITRI